MLSRIRGQRQARPVSVTSARTSRSADIRSRQTRYLISMGIRTACFVLAVVADGPLRWGLVIAAFILPYIAVVMANAGARPHRDEPTYVTGAADPELEAGTGSHDQT